MGCDFNWVTARFGQIVSRSDKPEVQGGLL